VDPTVKVRLPSATVVFNERVYGFFSATMLYGHPDIAVLMHCVSLFVDLTVFKRDAPTTYPATENSSK